MPSPWLINLLHSPNKQFYGMILVFSTCPRLMWWSQAKGMVEVSTPCIMGNSSNLNPPTLHSSGIPEKVRWGRVVIFWAILTGCCTWTSIKWILSSSYSWFLPLNPTSFNFPNPNSIILLGGIVVFMRSEKRERVMHQSSKNNLCWTLKSLPKVPLPHPQGIFPTSFLLKPPPTSDTWALHPLQSLMSPSSLSPGSHLLIAV